MNMLNMIFHYANRRIRKLARNISHRRTENNVEHSSSEENNNNIFIVFPYVKDITKTVKTSIVDSGVTLGYRCLNGIIKPHKDKNTMDENNVVKLLCKDCDASYVGQTKRQLKTRIKEHKSNIKLDPNKYSVVSKHIKSFNYSFDWEKVEVLDIEYNYFKRLTFEMIHIKEQKKRR